MKKTLLLIAFVFAAGCGGGGGGASGPPVSQYIDAGTLVASERALIPWNIGTAGWTITTTQGAFSAYTSVLAPVHSPVLAGKYIDTLNNKTFYTALQVGGKTYPVGGVVAFGNFSTPYVAP